MKKVADFMDYAIRSKWIENDAMIAVKVGVAAATVSRWRDGSRIPEDDEALVLAEVLMANPDELLPCVRYWKAKLPETKQVWERLARIAAAAVVMVAVMPNDSHAASHQSNGIDAMQLSKAYCFQKYRSLYRRGKRVFASVVRLIFQQSEAPQHIAVAH